LVARGGYDPTEPLILPVVVFHIANRRDGCKIGAVFEVTKESPA
jgi:hypothetical protein